MWYEKSIELEKRLTQYENGTLKGVPRKVPKNRKVIELKMPQVKIAGIGVSGRPK